MKHYDLAIVGGGLAGLTAAIVAGRHGLRTVVVEQLGAGGQVLNVEKIENFPGFPEGIAGYDLGPMVQEQAEAHGVEFALDTVQALEMDGRKRVLRCAEEDITARAVIIAAGSALRALGVPGEERLMGRGVSHCASCDAAFFAGQGVCVVGGGDSALDEAAVVAGQASRVLIVQRGPAFEAQQAIVEKIEALDNIETVFETQVEEILGEEGVSGVRLRDLRSGEERIEAVQGVFIFVGLEPNTAFIDGVVELDAGGHIVTDLQMRTSVPGVFAAGDIRQGSVGLLISAAGDGATAAVAAFRYLASNA